MRSRTRSRPPSIESIALAVCLAVLVLGTATAVGVSAESTPGSEIAVNDSFGEDWPSTAGDRSLTGLAWAGTTDGTGIDPQSSEVQAGTVRQIDDGDRLDPEAFTDQQLSGSRTIELDRSYRLLPDRPGEVLVEHRYSLPEGLSRLGVRLPEEATVVDRNGFVDGDGQEVVWDRSTGSPAITYRYEVNRTFDHAGPIEGPGDYVFVDVGDWALLNQPGVGHSWGWSGGGTVGFERSQRTDGPGAVGDQIVFLGPQETLTHEAHGQTFELVVPEAATLAESPSDLFDALAVGSDRLRVGDRDERVFLVAAPTDRVRWGVRGLQTGAADIWVRDMERLDTPENVWLHEYVHSRQDYRTTDETRWFTEATATYYAALFALEAGEIDFERFRSYLDRGAHERYDGVVLSDPATWRHSPEYVVGALVTGELDRGIRIESTGERSFQDVFRLVNEHPERITADNLQSFVESAGSAAVRSDADRYLTTDDRPRAWSAQEHASAFGTDPARIEYSLEAFEHEDAYRVDGPFRTRSLDADRPIRLVRGERLSVGATVRNFGGVEGDYEARFRVDGRVVDTRHGRLEPGESTRMEFNHTFDDPGEHTLAVGSDTVRVSVFEPAAADVTDVSVDQPRISPGDTVRLSLRVENSAELPAELEIPVVRNGEQIDRRTVRLDTGETTTVTVTDSIEEAGRYQYTFPGTTTESVTVRVEDDSVPGFGVVPALLSFLLVAGWLRYRRSGGGTA